MIQIRWDISHQSDKGELAWSFNAAQVKTEFLGHLGILTAVIERLGIVEKVNARISVSKEKGSKVSMTRVSSFSKILLLLE